MVGAMFGIPTGLIAYYAILKGHATPKEVAIIVSASFVSGCALGIALFWPSFLATPILTMVIAAWVRRRASASHRLSFRGAKNQRVTERVTP